MADLIDRQAAITSFKETDRCLKHFKNTEHIRKILGIIINHIEKMPAVDAVVLPCKAGDTVYRIRPVRIVWPDIRFTIDAEAFQLQDIPDFGKTVFRTREEAEEALKRREENEA